MEARRFSKGAEKLLIAGAAAFALAYLAWAAWSGALGNDFANCWRTANSPLGAAYRQRWENPFPYPPPTLVWLMPLRLVPAWPGYFLWTAIGTAGIVAAAWIMAGRRAALLTLISPAVIACVAVGQMGNLVGIVVLVAASRQRGWVCGVLFGLAITIKPQIAFAAPAILIVRRDWRGLGGCALAGLALLAAELALFGIEPWLAWMRGFAFFHRVVIAVHGNAASANPAGFAEFLGLPIEPFWLADALLAAWLIARRARSSGPLELAALVVLASVFLSPYAIIYDLGAAMPFLAVQASRGADRRPYLLALLWPWTSAAVTWAVVAVAQRGRQDARAPAAVAAQTRPMKVRD